MWDVHVRLGGTMGTNVNLANCPTTSTDLTKCATAYIGFHITPTGSGYFEVSNALTLPLAELIVAFRTSGFGMPVSEHVDSIFWFEHILNVLF